MGREPDVSAVKRTFELILLAITAVLWLPLLLLLAALESVLRGAWGPCRIVISEGEPDGSFTVTAHSNWEVTWSVTTSAGTEGDVFTGASQPSEVTVRVGEIQTYR
mgnify:CR=1 FL=1